MPLVSGTKSQAGGVKYCSVRHDSPAGAWVNVSNIVLGAVRAPSTHEGPLTPLLRRRT